MATVTDTWLDEHRVQQADLVDAPLIGIAHVEAEIRSLTARLADPARAELLGAEVPRSILLHGQPGAGKTHTARALALQLGDLPVYEVGADELTGPLVRSLFAALSTRHERCMLVVDEIDLVGGDRTEADAGAKRTLAALLTALDGLRAAAGILVVAATSQATWTLDPALLRAGRLGFVVEILLPDEATRRALLEHFLATRPLAPGTDVAPLAAAAFGTTPADLRALCIDAAGIALAAGRDHIGQDDLVAALGRRGRVLPEFPDPGPVDTAALARVCAHEAGHILVGSLLHGPSWLESVYIGTHAGSVTFAHRTLGNDAITEGVARDAIATLLGGLAGERVLTGEATLAHLNDVEAATDLARRLVERGHVPSVPPIELDGWLRGTALAGRLADGVAALLTDGRDRAISLVGRHPDLAAEVARHLAAEAIPLLEADRRRVPVAIDVTALRALVESRLTTPTPIAFPAPASAVHPTDAPTGAPMHTGTGLGDDAIF